MEHALEVDVWSDVACPWCYIGKRQLEAGIAAFARRPEAAPVEVVYRSYQLNPEAPYDFPGTHADFLVQHKQLPEQRVAQMLDRVTDVARSVGLRYDFDALRPTNTRKAHQLLHYARARGVQRDAKERLLSAYFREGRHLGRDDTLAELAGDIGLDPEDVRRSLGDGEHVEAVEADRHAAADRGIASVPFAVIDGRHAVPGVQPPEIFAEAFARVAAERTGPAAHSG